MTLAAMMAERFDTSLVDDDSDEYEYEYDDNETETFLVDIDLSAFDPGKRTAVGTQRVFHNPETPDHARLQTTYPNGRTADEAGPESSTLAAEVRHHGNEDTAASRQAQILDLHTDNPLVAYQGSIYSCVWTDTIGTSMFFTQPGSLHPEDALQSTADYDLIGKSRIKLTGQRAKVTKKQGMKRSRADEEDASTTPPASEDPGGRSFGNFMHTHPITNLQLRQQAGFLEKLMNVKKARGETDLVRTWVDGPLRPSRSDRREEIERLNRKVVAGDKEALQELGKIYSQSEQESGPVERPEQNTTTAENHSNDVAKSAEG